MKFFGIAGMPASASGYARLEGLESSLRWERTSAVGTDLERVAADEWRSVYDWPTARQNGRE
ncbi:hypothetical protein [Natrinema caseinilyticum]|uniref:hypothetical protein n=1 Tax=Natrinema caseinilyticum TaxID=2961570 RepID=UPI0020C1D488|nr:hypothetical protein [Natrinema caseinilyticum]